MDVSAVVAAKAIQIGVVRRDLFLTALTDCGIDVSSPVVREVVDFCADGTSVLYQQFFDDIQAGNYSLEQLQPPSGIETPPEPKPLPLPANPARTTEDSKATTPPAAREYTLESVLSSNLMLMSRQVKEQLAKSRVELAATRDQAALAESELATLRKQLTLETERRHLAEKQLNTLREERKATAEQSGKLHLESQNQLDMLTAQVAQMQASTSGTCVQRICKALYRGQQLAARDAVLWWRATQVAHNELRPAAEAIARLRMHQELRQALEAQAEVAQAQSDGQRGQLEGELDSTKAWLTTALGERATVERELVAEVKRLQLELKQAREVLLDEGSKTRERLAKADISAQRSDRRFVREKEQTLRLQNTMDAVCRAFQNDHKKHGELVPTGAPPSLELKSRIPEHQLPTPLPAASKALRKLAESVQQVFGDIQNALNEKDQGEPGDETSSTASTKRYALNTSLRALHEALVVTEVSTQTVEKRAARVAEDLHGQSTPQSTLTIASERPATPDQNAVSMADMAITNQRLAERLRLIKQRAGEKELQVEANICKQLKSRTAAAFNQMHSVVAQLAELQLAIQDAENVTQNSSKANEAALEFEASVLESQAKRDTVDVLPTIRELQPIAVSQPQEKQISDDEVGRTSERLMGELSNQIECISRLSVELDGAMASCNSQTQTVEKTKEHCQKIVASLQASYHEINAAGVRFKMKDRLVQDTGPETIDQKAQKFRGDLDLTVIEGFDLPGSPNKASADVADKWEVCVSLGAEINTTMRKASNNPRWSRP